MSWADLARSIAARIARFLRRIAQLLEPESGSTQLRHNGVFEYSMSSPSESITNPPEHWLARHRRPPPAHWVEKVRWHAPQLLEGLNLPQETSPQPEGLQPSQAMNTPATADFSSPPRAGRQAAQRTFFTRQQRPKPATKSSRAETSTAQPAANEQRSAPDDLRSTGTSVEPPPLSRFERHPNGSETRITPPHSSEYPADTETGHATAAFPQSASTVVRNEYPADTDAKNVIGTPSQSAAAGVRSEFPARTEPGSLTTTSLRSALAGVLSYQVKPRPQNEPEYSDGNGYRQTPDSR